MNPKSHPRYVSLNIRDTIVSGVEKGITPPHGLLAHGRGEAFDYLIGEKTQSFAKKAITASAALLLLSKHPVISVNGNVCALVPKELVKLSKVIPAPLEVNIYHTSQKRETLMKKELLKHGANKVLMPSKKCSLKYTDSNRRLVNCEGIYKADVVIVPLEDGDRCEALIKSGKKVITVDLNPLSRTSQTATITIVDNLARCMDLLISEVKRLKGSGEKKLQDIVKKYDNKRILKEAEKKIRK